MKLKLHLLSTIALFSCLNIFSQVDFQGRVVMENINSTPYVSSIKEADMDGDGDLDIVSADGYDIKWFENVGGDNIETISHHISDLGGRYINAGDMDNDGDIDVLVQNLTTLYYIENLGDDNFAEPFVLKSTNNSNYPFYAFSIDDIDSDGDMDIAYTYRQDSWRTHLKWFENTDGNGTFVSNDINLYSYSKALITADLDSDGDMDILTYNTDNKEIEWFVNDGAQNFTEESVTSAQLNGYATINVGDIDGDNDLDLIISDSEGYSSSLEEVKIVKNDGAGGFTVHQSILSSVLDFSYIEVNDMDGDGDLDVAFSSSTDHSVGWFQNIDGNGTLGDNVILNFNAEKAKCVISYDFDSDGDIDILSASQSDDKIAWYENASGTGDFENEQVITSSINSPKRVIAVDVDGDGDLDVMASSGYDSKLAWYENLDGNGDFGLQRIIGSDILSIEGFVAKDLDNDGDLDVATGNSNSTSSPLFWYENLDGLGNFSRAISLGGTSGLNEIESADLDGDGDNDLIYNVSWASNIITWRENTDGEGNFSGNNEITTSIGSGDQIMLKDINNDGFIDVIIEGQNDFGWYENDGNANFTEHIVEANYYECYSFSIFDVDQDGDLDIVSAYKFSYSGSSRVGWYENLDGQGNFDAVQFIDTDIPGSQFDEEVELYASDLNNDGYTDILARTTSEVSWYENTDALGTFAPYNVIIGGNARYHDIHLADMNSDGKTDLLSTYGISAYANDFMDDKILWYKNIGLGSNEISGITKLDVLSNGCSASSQNLPNVMVVANSNTQSLATFSLSNGFYQLFPNLGTYTTSVASSFGNYYSSNPTSYEFTFTELEVVETANFCVEPLLSIDDIAISIIPTSEARPGFNTTYQIVYRNIGTTNLSGTIDYQFDGNKLNFLNASQNVASQSANSLTFNFSNLLPLETRVINVEFNLLPPPTVNIGEILNHVLTINPNAGDQFVYVFNQTVIGSYDPNDMTVLEGEEIFIEDADKYLHYVIRFQNTGTASAINVRVETVLDDKLDWTTMQIESLSHENGRVEIVNESEVSFIFNNIYLPDSTNNEPGSHGFIAYKIKPKSNVEIGDVFSGVSDIYFDYNPAIRTNTVYTEIVAPLSVNEFETESIKLFPNPAKHKLTIKSNQIIDKLTIIDINGRLLKSINNSDMDYSLDVLSFSKGVYFLEIQSGESKSVKMFIKN